MEISVDICIKLIVVRMFSGLARWRRVRGVRPRPRGRVHDPEGDLVCGDEQTGGDAGVDGGNGTGRGEKIRYLDFR